MCRSLMPMISAACHHVIFFAMARKITSCTFIAHRGLRVREHACHVLLPSPPEKRTDHVLSQPDISCANDTGKNGRLPNAPRSTRMAALNQSEQSVSQSGENMKTRTIVMTVALCLVAWAVCF